MLVMMLAQPRIFLAMSRDGLLPAWAARIHPRYHTPHVATIVTGVIVAIAAGLTPIATLGDLVSIGTLMAFVIVAVGVVVLRRTRPDLPRPFRMPLVPFLPLAVGRRQPDADARSAVGDVGAADHLDDRRRHPVFLYGHRNSRLRSEGPGRAGRASSGSELKAGVGGV